MSQLDDIALQHVLDGDRPNDPDDELADAIARAERDVQRLRRGLLLAAADEPEPRIRRRRYGRPLVIAAAAAAAVAAVGVALVSLDDGDEGRQVASAPVTEVAAPPETALASPPQTALGSPPQTAIGSPPPDGPALTPTLGAPAPAQDLAGLTRTAERIVVGRIERVDRGSIAPPGEPPENGMPYALATISVQESLKPAGDAIEKVVAFDYDYGGVITPDSGGGGWVVGQEVLVFLVSDAGTVSEDVQPAHLQLLEGARGRFPILDGQLQAPFSLDDVRAMAGSG